MTSMCQEINKMKIKCKFIGSVKILERAGTGEHMVMNCLHKLLANNETRVLFTRCGGGSRCSCSYSSLMKNFLNPCAGVLFLLNI